MMYFLFEPSEVELDAHLIYDDHYRVFSSTPTRMLLNCWSEGLPYAAFILHN